MADNGQSRDDLLIVDVELRADEAASANGIKEQLPRIAALINKDNSIKLAVSLDEAAAQADVKRMTSKLSNAVKNRGVELSVELDRASVGVLQSELQKIGVSSGMTRSLTAEMDKMGLVIDRVTHSWHETANAEGRVLNLVIQGTDQQQRQVSVAKQFMVTVGDTGEIYSELRNTVTRATSDLERQRVAQEKINESARKANDDRLAFLAKQRSVLEGVQASYAQEDGTTAKPVVDTAHIAELGTRYDEIAQKIAALENAQGALTRAQKADVEAQIRELSRLAQSYKNTEYVATQLRTKTVTEVNAEQGKKLTEYESELRNAGNLTAEFQQKISDLRVQLNAAFDRNSLTAFLGGFDALRGEVDAFQAKIRGVDEVYTKLIQVSKRLAVEQGKLTQVNPVTQPEAYAAQEKVVEALREQRTELQDQIVAAGELAEHSKKRLEYAQEQELLNRKAGVAEAEIADKARQADEGYQSVGVTVEGLRVKMERLSEPSQTLLANMAALNDVMRQYAEADDDKTKIALWERMQELIASCRREITGLAAVENGSVRQFKLSQSLEKAQADLETIRRTWSAFQKDPGLRTQFQLLEEGLHRCNTEADFKKWSAELNTFKSQVKAAGLNTLSFADSVKDAFGKVFQWFSATSMLFKTFEYIKRGINTVIDLDTAMVDLRKTTDATEAEYRQFYDTANETAKRLNMTTEAVISQTASWSRLGYSMDAAAKLAENSAIFAAVSPEMTVDEATDGLVSILKAFDIEAENSLDGIISKVNEVGNRFAVTNKDIVDALTRSSSAMAAANNTFEETIALATAGIEITRDSEGMGQGLKTLSMRIRAIDEETEEYSEDIAILRGQIADLTKVASNNYTGVSLFEPGDPETYRSTYDILQDISKIWGELTDKNRAQLLEALFGKRQANVCLYAQKCA